MFLYTDNRYSQYLAGKRGSKPSAQHFSGSLFGKMEKGGTQLWKNFWLQRKQLPVSRQPEIIDHTSGYNH